jgi:hypothetical protein
MRESLPKLYGAKVADAAWDREDPHRWKLKFEAVVKEDLPLKRMLQALGHPSEWSARDLAELLCAYAVRAFGFGCSHSSQSGLQEYTSNKALQAERMQALLFNMRSMALELEEADRFKGKSLAAFCAFSSDSSLVPLPYFTDLAEGGQIVWKKVLRQGPSVKQPLFVLDGTKGKAHSTADGARPILVASPYGRASTVFEG